jgi:hypothetical protein
VSVHATALRDSGREANGMIDADTVGPVLPATATRLTERLGTAQTERMCEKAQEPSAPTATTEPPATPSHALARTHPYTPVHTQTLRFSQVFPCAQFGDREFGSAAGIKEFVHLTQELVQQS